MRLMLSRKKQKIIWIVVCAIVGVSMVASLVVQYY